MQFKFSVTLTTRNRSLRGIGSPVIYLDAFARNIKASDWKIRNTGVRVIRNKGEQRLSFTVKTFGKQKKGFIIELDVEFEFNSFIAFTISPKQNYAYFAVLDECGQRIFSELLEKQPKLQDFEWSIEPNSILTSLSGETDDIFGLWIRFDKREDLFTFTDCETYHITRL